MRLLPVFVLALLVLLLPPAALSAGAEDGERHALIIANTGYSGGLSALVNPAKDAALLRKALMTVGFAEGNITILKDASREGMLGGIEAHARRLAQSGPGAVGFLYYAGHGFGRTETGQNFLVPVSITALADATPEKAVLLEDVRKALAQHAPEAAHIVVFDACRNELQTRTRGVAQGFVSIPEWGGMLIAYSTEPGKTATDGDPKAEAGPFAMTLAEVLMTARGLSASDLFATVRINVRSRTGGQSPSYLYSLNRAITFNAVRAGADKPAEETNGAAPEARPAATVAQAWAAVKNSEKTAELEAFIAKHGDSQYGVFARERLKVLTEKAKVAAAPAETEPPAMERACKGVAVTYARTRWRCLKPGGGKSFKDCPKCPEMVVVPQGAFTMGEDAPASGAPEGYGPTHQVTIPKPFAVSKFEITAAEWAACAAEKGCVPKQPDPFCKKEDCAVADLSWSQILNQYLRWISNKTGQSYRLLSEAEWEYVARAGSSTRYGFGDDPKALNWFAWFAGNADRRIHPVGALRGNGWGLHDMHGNVGELVQDCWNGDYAEKPNVLRRNGGAWKTGDCRFVVFRGGSWNDEAENLGSAVRGRAPASDWGANIGFRIARSVTP